MLSTNVKSAYDQFYEQNDVAWRMLGAKAKAQNIVDVCKDISPDKILEVGAGDGSILHFLEEWNFGKELYALEISESGVKVIESRNLNKLKEVNSFDGYKIPYPDQSFDLVILAHVLEHVEHERILLRELKRVAKNIVIEVPLDYRFGVDKRMKHFLDYGHINMYTPTSLRFLLQSEGMEIIADKTSLTGTEAIRFNQFKNMKRKKTLLRQFKIEMEYRVKQTLSQILGNKRKEQFANAYTVLTKRSSQDLQIF
ncbi:class I SAM-dependent methyltransferase [Pedobacter duraquae]|uniref:Methyltransferase family protein n=1 Tax=Pedobacter duraquae TaxID=425511 RepID=A0A4R6IDM9_9SPHI|nr:class I SAM-dependent methyltransferase [Pedobacter duraquae]TDO20122.1 methyltransferase family protein [Pedobacter duraquae]